VDASGNAFVGGLAASLSFPTTPGAFQTTAAPYPGGAGNGHGFLTKLNPDGTSLVFSTYLAGTNTDQVNGLALDGSGNVYVTGQTASLDFPTTPGAFQSGSYGSDSFIAKFSSSGSLVYSTYFGGPGFGNAGNGTSTQSKAIAVDSNGAAYVTGSTLASLPVTPGAYESVPFFIESAFVTKLHPAGCGLLYSTYVGYGDFSFGAYGATGIALDKSKDVYITGNAFLTVSPGVPGPALVNGLQPPMSSTEGTSNMILISELDPAGAALLYSSFLGGSGTNTSSGIGVDSSGDIYVTGTTNAPDFPMAGPFEATGPACEDDKPVGTGAFVTKISPQPANAVLLTRNSLTFAHTPLNFANNEVLAVALMNQRSTPLDISSVKASPFRPSTGLFLAPEPSHPELAVRFRSNLRRAFTVRSPVR